MNAKVHSDLPAHFFVRVNLFRDAYGGFHVHCSAAALLQYMLCWQASLSCQESTCVAVPCKALDAFTRSSAYTDACETEKPCRMFVDDMLALLGLGDIEVRRTPLTFASAVCRHGSSALCDKRVALY